MGSDVTACIDFEMSECEVAAPLSVQCLLITIDRVSMDSRGAASMGDFGFTNEICGQT